VWRRALPPETLHTTETGWQVDDKTIIELYLIWHMTGVMDMIKEVDEGLFMILQDVMEERLEEAGYDVSFE
jgi:heterodisulfide reductase subunit C